MAVESSDSEVFVCIPRRQPTQTPIACLHDVVTNYGVACDLSPVFTCGKPRLTSHHDVVANYALACYLSPVFTLCNRRIGSGVHG